MGLQELDQYNTISRLAGEDLSAAGYQWRFGKLNSSAKVIRCTITGEQAIGVICGNPATDRAVDVQIGGVAKVEAGAAVTAGDKIMTDTVGRAITQTGVNAVLGIALAAAGAAGERFSVLLTGSDGTPGGGLETVSAPGAIAPGVYETHLEVDGTDAFTMGDGTYVGQRKRITCITAANTPVGTVTLNGAQAAFGTEPTAFVFTTVGQFVEWEWTATGWKIVALGQVGVESLTNGQTANPLCLTHFVNLTGANDYIQGDGIIAGQRSVWIVTAGANASTISGLFYTTAGAATGVDLQVNAASDMAVLSWGGSRWVPENLVSTTVA